MQAVAQIYRRRFWSSKFPLSALDFVHSGKICADIAVSQGLRRIAPRVLASIGVRRIYPSNIVVRAAIDDIHTPCIRMTENNERRAGQVQIKNGGRHGKSSQLRRRLGDHRGAEFDRRLGFLIGRLQHITRGGFPVARLRSGAVMLF